MRPEPKYFFCKALFNHKSKADFMVTRLITPPATEPVTTAEAKLHLRVDDAAEDALIASPC